MATKAMTLVGLDVHARQTHAAILEPDSGEVRGSRLRMPAIEVAAFLQRLGPRAASASSRSAGPWTCRRPPMTSAPVAGVRDGRGPVGPVSGADAR